MSNTQSKQKKKRPSADEMAEMAMRGEDVTKYFGPGKMMPPVDKIEVMPPIQRVNVDLNLPMLKELDIISDEINISRQSLIKMWLRESLDKYYQSKKFRKA